MFNLLYFTKDIIAIPDTPIKTNIIPNIPISPAYGKLPLLFDELVDFFVVLLAEELSPVEELLPIEESSPIL